MVYMEPVSTCVIQVTKKCTEWETAKDGSAVTESVSKFEILYKPHLTKTVHELHLSIQRKRMEFIHVYSCLLDV